MNSTNINSYTLLKMTAKFTINYKTLFDEIRKI